MLLSRLNEVVTHHAHIFMFQHMTVVKVKTGEILEFEQDFHLLSRHNEDSIVPTLINKAVTECGSSGTGRPIDMPFQHLELQPVDMHGMRQLHSQLPRRRNTGY